jgi:hypothetical protein
MNYNKNLSLESIAYFCEVDNKWKFEQWKDIPNFEGFYQSSDLGRIKSLERWVDDSKRGRQFKKERILKSCFDKDGYLMVGLYKNKIGKTLRINQLVGIAFLGHVPCGLERVVEHKNHIRHDNRLINLEIITSRENTDRKHLPSTSQYVGVFINKSSNRWASKIVLNKKNIHLGYFDTEEEASEYYQNALKAINDNKEIVVKRKVAKSISYHKKNKKWLAYFYSNYKIKHLGYFETELEAYLAVEKYKKENNIT